MAVDKDLFLYDMAVVVTIKNEAPYIKEWIDFHILAGVDHFYIYDHGSTDNLKEILQPYIELGVVTYQTYPERLNMMTVYNDALREYRFFCRYIAFIDADEFIFPKSNKSISEVTDEILEDNSHAGGLAVNWQIFGSNFQEKADYTKGVLERFTRRAEKNFYIDNESMSTLGNVHIKTIVNPRRVHLIDNPHWAEYFQGFNAVNENGEGIETLNNPVTVEKIVVHHYAIKSYEENEKRRNVSPQGTEGTDKFLNKEFDDSILDYRNARLRDGKDKINPVDYKKITEILKQNLAPTLNPNVSKEFLTGKFETFLTCRAVCSHLKNFLTDKDAGRILEETALNAICKTCHTNLSITDVSLLIAELPKILVLDYPVVDDIRQNAMVLISEMKNLWSDQQKKWGQPDRNKIWTNWAELDYILEMLKTFDAYKQK